jgi:hypothetical protein
MKTLRPFSILLLFAVVLLSACKDDDESPNEEKEKLLAGETSKDWKVTAITGSTNHPAFSALSIDIFNNTAYLVGQPIPISNYDLPEFPACAKDNIITFKRSDKTYTVSEGASTCSTAYAFELTSGTWEFTDDKETLKLTDNSGSVFTYNVVKLTEQTIEGENEGEFSYGGSNIDYTIKTTFTAQ